MFSLHLRLNIQDPLRGVVRADTEIKVVLEWDADIQVSDIQQLKIVSGRAGLRRLPSPNPMQNRFRRFSLYFQRLAENQCFSAIG
jgi:hypothetical protein